MAVFQRADTLDDCTFLNGEHEQRHRLCNQLTLWRTHAALHNLDQQRVDVVSAVERHLLVDHLLLVLSDLNLRLFDKADHK